MFRNNNGAVARRLAKRSLSADKRRNIIAVIAIALTALLFTSVFTMGFGLVESIQRATMVMSGGDGHAAVKYVTDEEYEKISSNPLVKEMAYCRMLCDSADNESLLKRHTEFWYYDDVGLKYGFTETSGSYPYTGMSSGTLRSGDTASLANEESITITGLPEGTEYTVTEEDYAVDGYTSSNMGSTGVLSADTPQTASFTNTHSGASETLDNPGTPGTSGSPGTPGTSYEDIGDGNIPKGYLDSEDSSTGGSLSSVDDGAPVMSKTGNSQADRFANRGFFFFSASLLALSAADFILRKRYTGKRLRK